MLKTEMDDITAEQIADTINDDNLAMFAGQFYLIQEAVHANAVDKGFWDAPRNEGECIALMHSELSEALEAIRKSEVKGHLSPDFTLLEEEFADVIIRIMDYAEAANLKVAEAVHAKAKFNRDREQMHGKKF